MVQHSTRHSNATTQIIQPSPIPPTGNHPNSMHHPLPTKQGGGTCTFFIGKYYMWGVPIHPYTIHSLTPLLLPTPLTIVAPSR